MSAQQPRSHIVRNGLIFGTILGLLEAGNALIQWAVASYPLVANSSAHIAPANLNNIAMSLVLSGVVFLATLALTFLTGMLAARSTGNVGSGALSGLMAGIVGALIGGGADIVTFALGWVMLGYVWPGAALATAPHGISLTFRGIPINVLLDAGIGAGMGALGGLIGASAARAQHQNLHSVPPAQ